MTAFRLVRHGHTAALGRELSGRGPIGLSGLGRRQADQLAGLLAAAAPDVLCSSPRPRAQETLAPLSRMLGLPIRTLPAFDEIDFGTWTGRTLTDLESEPKWHAWNRDREGERPPGGEWASAVQTRFLAGLSALHRQHPRGLVVVASHADPILYAVLGVVGAPLAALGRLTLPPAAVIDLIWEGDGPRLQWRSVGDLVSGA